jgi:hypothetical protein
VLQICDLRRLAVLLAFALSAMPGSMAHASSRTDLNRDWQFRADPQESGEASGWISAVPSDTQSVALPHTWNIGRLHDYLGAAWYFRRFEMPRPPPGAHLELHFGATFYSARIWLNGVELGRHEAASPQDEQGHPIAHGQRHFDKLTEAVSIEGALPTDISHNYRRLLVTLLPESGFIAAERTLEWTPQH